MFGAGTVLGFSDAQLLEQFESRSAAAVDDILAAEQAFQVLVARHGARRGHGELADQPAIVVARLELA